MDSGLRLLVQVKGFKIRGSKLEIQGFDLIFQGYIFKIMVKG